jgi:hypothetical protein
LVENEKAQSKIAQSKNSADKYRNAVKSSTRINCRQAAIAVTSRSKKR